MHTANFSPRIASLRGFLADHKLDALVCRLNQNVMMLSGYCPMNGLSLAVLPRQGEPILIIPKQDERFAQDTWVADVRTYPWGDTQHLDPLASLLPLLAAVAVDHKLSGKRVGIEMEYPIASLPVFGAEIRQWTGAALQQMKGALAAGEFVDVFADLHIVASRKTPYELDRIRAANRLGGLALETFRANVAPGKRECEIAAAVERAVHAEGPSREKVTFARAWATVMSGANTQYAGQTYNVSTDRAVEEGDLVSIELGLVADGFWTDLTRVHLAGKAKPPRDEAYRKLHGEVVRAHDAAAAAIKPGGKWSDVDHAARAVIDATRQAEFFPHITGHGVGFCYHEIHPLIGPGIDHTIEPGQVVTIEPAVYKPDPGGIRHEDVYLVTDRGAENLSPFYRGLDAQG